MTKISTEELLIFIITYWVGLVLLTRCGIPSLLTTPGQSIKINKNWFAKILKI